MDRSYLSHAEVIAASRNFVCIRLATYEDQEEAAFLQSLMRTASGELENSVFAILSADGKTPLVRTARSPKRDFAGAAALARTMNRLARENPVTSSQGAQPAALPLVANLRLALDVAACDNQPLVVVCGFDGANSKSLQERLAALVWSDEFIGKLLVVNSNSAKELKLLDRVPDSPSVLIVQPDRFGLKGAVLAQIGASATNAELVAGMRAGIQRFQSPAGTFAGHVRDGRQLGVFWETVVPVTDPMERQARAKGRDKALKNDE